MREYSQKPREKKGISSLRAWTKVLHLGEFGGVFSKLLYTFAGLMPPGLFITGVLMWWRKKRAKM